MPRAGKIAAGAEPLAKTSISISSPLSLCRVQRTTRALCRSAGFGESAVFQAVIAVTEFAYRLYLESPRRVEIELTALRHKEGLELRAENVGSAGLAPVRVSVPFPHAVAANAGRGRYE